MNRYLAELFGTFALVFCGTGAIIINEISNGTVTHVGVAITFGLIVTAMIYSIGSISGAHINPAVTVAFALAGLFPKRQILPYCIAQTMGAILASGLLYILFPEAATRGETIPSGSIQQSFLLEIILSLILMFVILHVATGAKEEGLTAGLAIGVVVLLEAMFAGPISGASMNPARSIAPALVSWNLTSLWVYILAPILGCTFAVWIWKWTRAS